jgi:formylglycine-generating enzyme
VTEKNVRREYPMSDVGFVACVALSDEPSHPGMVWIPGGTFRMGSDKHYPEEAPSHRVTVSGFWMDRTPVTNRDFASSSTQQAT